MKHERIYKVRKLESGKYALEFTNEAEILSAHYTPEKGWQIW